MAKVLGRQLLRLWPVPGHRVPDAAVTVVKPATNTVRSPWSVLRAVAFMGPSASINGDRHMLSAYPVGQGDHSSLVQAPLTALPAGSMTPSQSILSHEPGTSQAWGHRTVPGRAEVDESGMGMK